MCKARAAAEIEPVERIASSSAILPGPMRSPFSRSMRMDRRVPAMDAASLDKSEVSHAQLSRSVKRHSSAPYAQGPARARLLAHTLYFIGYCAVVKGAPDA